PVGMSSRSPQQSSVGQRTRASMLAKSLLASTGRGTWPPVDMIRCGDDTLVRPARLHRPPRPAPPAPEMPDPPPPPTLHDYQEAAALRSSLRAFLRQSERLAAGH